ncbi:hypothetical protein M231_00575 [Tremella mesenterica]|uniref:Protein YOP1 n=1 Tax=Tremella mesenterica TaxID=5217 RepID=A0A4V1M508_TREME|nr:hypothetical protein M231_00575 [Tremella mesenterica]
MDPTTPAQTDAISPEPLIPVSDSSIPLTPAPGFTQTTDDVDGQATTNPDSRPHPAVTGLRQRVNKLSTSVEHAAEHPTVKQARGAAGRQIEQFREILGKSEWVREAEKRSGVDRVWLVVGGAFAYLLLIPLNIFGLGLPTTTLLTFVPPSYLALDLLDRSPAGTTNKDEQIKSLLSYFVVLGYIQFLESLAAGVLARRIPQYYTLKLVFLAYLLHPSTNGAIKIHNAVFRPFIRSPIGHGVIPTPPQTVSGNQSQGASPETREGVKLPSGPGSGVGMEVPK